MLLWMIRAVPVSLTILFPHHFFSIEGDVAVELSIMNGDISVSLQMKQI